MITCTLCGGTCRPWISSPIDPKTGKPTPYGRAALCDGCNTGAIYPLPEPSEIPAFYMLERYYTHGRSHFAEVKPTLADRILTKFAWLIDRGRGVNTDAMCARFNYAGTVCDLGCGAGHYLIELQQRGWTVTGVDPDHEARAALGAKNITALDGTAEQLPPEIRSAKFDLVILTHTLEHCREPIVALKNAASLLKPDGRLLIEVPNKDCIHFETFGPTSDCYDAPRHLFFFGPASLRRLVEQCGLRVDEEYHHGLTRHHDPSWRATERRIIPAAVNIDSSSRGAQRRSDPGSAL